MGCGPSRPSQDGVAPPGAMEDPDGDIHGRSASIDWAQELTKKMGIAIIPVMLNTRGASSTAAHWAHPWPPIHRAARRRCDEEGRARPAADGDDSALVHEELEPDCNARSEPPAPLEPPGAGAGGKRAGLSPDESDDHVESPPDRRRDPGSFRQRTCREGVWPWSATRRSGLE